LLLRLTKTNELLTEARDPLSKTSGLLLCTKTSLNTRQSKLRALQTEVTGRLRTGLCQLLSIQTKATTCFGRTGRGARADLPQLPSCLGRLQRAVCRRLKSAGSHLGRRASLLLKDVPLQFLLCHSLTRPAESTCLNSLSADILLRELALPSDVGQSLLDCSVFKGAHELQRGIGRQPSNTLPSSTHPEIGGFHKLALGLGRRRPSAICRDAYVDTCLLQRCLSGRYLTRDLTSQITCCPERLLQSCNTFFGQTCCSLEIRLV
jgi:hypothetical protein